MLLHNYHSPENTVVLEISQSLETLRDPSLSDEERQHEYQQLQKFAQANDVRLASSIVLAQEMVQEMERSHVQVRVRVESQQLERLLEPGAEMMLEMTLEIVLKRVLKPKPKMVSALLLGRMPGTEMVQEQELMLGLEWAQEEAQILESSLESELRQKYGQTLMSGVELQQAVDYASQAQQEQIVFIGSSLLCITILLLLLGQRNQTSLSLTGQLICFLPEEYVAELGALYQNLSSNQQSVWLIRLIVIWAALELFWAFYIQIKLENLWLPQKGDTSKIDE